jgi:hypothetical protein
VMEIHVRVLPRPCHYLPGSASCVSSSKMTAPLPACAAGDRDYHVLVGHYHRHHHHQTPSPSPSPTTHTHAARSSIPSRHSHSPIPMAPLLHFQLDRFLSAHRSILYYNPTLSRNIYSHHAPCLFLARTYNVDGRSTIEIRGLIDRAGEISDPARPAYREQRGTDKMRTRTH